MRELLSVLRSADTSPAELRASWARCYSIGGGIEAVLERVQASGPLDDTTREALDRLVRLNAITRQAVGEHQAQLAKSLVRSRETGAKLRGYAPGAAPAGGKCDLAG